MCSMAHYVGHTTSTRWDPTCHMCWYVQDSCETCWRNIKRLVIREASFLIIGPTEWKQIEYLIYLAKVFNFYTQWIGESKYQPFNCFFPFTIAYSITSTGQVAKLLLKKTPSWTESIWDGSEAADTKLSAYYFQTQRFLGELHGKAAVLSPAAKDSIFKGDNCNADKDEIPWHECYYIPKYAIFRVIPELYRI